MKKYDIDEIRKQLDVIQNITCKCLKDSPDKEMLLATLYQVNQHVHNIQHNINNYGVK